MRVQDPEDAEVMARIQARLEILDLAQAASEQGRKGDGGQQQL